MVAARRVQEEGRVRDRTGQGAVDRDALEGLGARPGRDASALRLDADQLGPGGGDAHRAGAVRAEGGGNQAGGDGGGRTAGRAARGVALVPGVAGGAEGGALGEGPLAQLAGVGLADDDRTGRAQPPYRLAVLGHRRELAGAAERGRLARHVRVVLHGHRDAEQRPAPARRQLPVGGVGFGERRLGPHEPEGVEEGWLAPIRARVCSTSVREVTSPAASARAHSASPAARSAVIRTPPSRCGGVFPIAISQLPTER